MLFTVDVENAVLTTIYEAKTTLLDSRQAATNFVRPSQAVGGADWSKVHMINFTAVGED